MKALLFRLLLKRDLFRNNFFKIPLLFQTGCGPSGIFYLPRILFNATDPDLIIGNRENIAAIVSWQS